MEEIVIQLSSKMQEKVNYMVEKRVDAMLEELGNIIPKSLLEQQVTVDVLKEIINEQEEEVYYWWSQRA